MSYLSTLELKQKYDESEKSFMSSVIPLYSLSEAPTPEKMEKIIENIIKKHNEAVKAATTYYSKMINSINS